MMKNKYVRVVVVLLAAIVLSFLLAFCVTEIWNSTITKYFNVGEIKFLQTWMTYMVLSIFPVSVVIID